MFHRLTVRESSHATRHLQSLRLWAKYACFSAAVVVRDDVDVSEKNSDLRKLKSCFDLNLIFASKVRGEMRVTDLTRLMRLQPKKLEDRECCDWLNENDQRLELQIELESVTRQKAVQIETVKQRNLSLNAFVACRRMLAKKE